MDFKKLLCLFLHELAHKDCYPNLTGECVNEFRVNILWWCENV